MRTAEEEGRTPVAEEHEDREALLRVVEELGLMLADTGFPRMPARVFAYVLAEDRDQYTAAELAEGLQVSPAAISGAVRLLVQYGMLIKGREPGARSDHYRIDDTDVWATINAQRLPLLQRWEEIMADAVRQLGAQTRGGRRLLESQAYFRFLSTEWAALQDRWLERKPDLVAELEGELDQGVG